jgi:ubiquinone/menaquinone biosynthesis C-methylase UbiE
LTHHHKGKTSEEYLDKAAILRALKIKPGQTILDAGCGNGYMAREFARDLKGDGFVYAMDTDGEAIDRLRSETERTIIEPIEGDVTGRTPMKESSVDLIYLSTVFHGFTKEEVSGFKTEAMRLLKPGGRLAIVEIRKEETPFGPPLEIRFSPEDLRREIGMPPLETVDAGEFFYMQLFEKS